MQAIIMTEAGTFLAISGAVFWLIIGWKTVRQFRKLRKRLRTLPRRLAWALWR